jgi:antitoxin (DNA-binding transcriptional repressor) of toxin-antitoxin stability system
MATISMSEFGRDWNTIISKVQEGETVVVTDEGKAAVQLQPAHGEAAAPSDPASEETPISDLSWMWELGERLVPPGPTTKLTNEEIDRIVYGI